MSGSTRISFTLTLPDGQSHECRGRLVETIPARRPGAARYRSAGVEPAGAAAPTWVIHVLDGPEIYDQMGRQSAPLDIVLSDGRTGKVLISDEATLRGSGLLVDVLSGKTDG